MNRRIINKKDAKLLFNDSPVDELNYNLDLDFSSDDDNLMKLNSEVLWSKDFCEYPDSFESFSSLTERTLSSCSWHNDDFDMNSTNKVNESLKAIDDALYERIRSPYMTESVFQECVDWAEKFPYFRIKGEQIVKPVDSNHTSHSVFSDNVKQFNFRNLSANLLLEGQKLPIHPAYKHRDYYFDGDNDEVPIYFDSKENKDHEDYLNLHGSDNTDYNVHESRIDHIKSSGKALQEKVIDMLVSEMWPSILSFLEKLDETKHSLSDFQLPPIKNNTEEQKILSLQRPKTEGGIANMEFPKLENILSVSPKILQQKYFQNGCISRMMRPNSEMSINMRKSSKSVIPTYHNISSTNMHLNCDSLDVKRVRNESKNVCLVLPALEEDFQDCSSILRGFHIEPERKEVPQSKSVLSNQNQKEPHSTTKENEYFLPPIEDKNYVLSKTDLEEKLFNFYEPTEKNKRVVSSRYKKIRSRPSTSLSKKVDENVLHPFTLNNELFISAVPGNSFKASTSNTSQNLEFMIEENETDAYKKSVTLFPIVTSLTPHEEKYQNVKKGFPNFLEGKKR